MKKLLKYICLISTLFLIAACGNPFINSINRETSTRNMPEREDTVRVATSYGPSSDLFFDEIAPILEDAGYIVVQHGFGHIDHASQILAEDRADLHIEQNAIYMRNYNKEHDTDLVSLTEIPSVPMTIYPANKRSFGEVAQGDRIGIPEEPTNLARGLKLLEEANLIVLDDEVEIESLDKNAIEENIYDIDIQPIRSADISKKMDDLEYAIIPGAFMYENDLSFYTALLVEEMTPEVILQAVVKREDEKKEWARLVKEAYNHEEFLEEVEKINEEPGSMRWVIP